MCRLQAAPTVDLDVCAGATTRILEAQIVSVILAWSTYPIHCWFTPARILGDVFTTRLDR